MYRRRASTKRKVTDAGQLDRSDPLEASSGATTAVSGKDNGDWYTVGAIVTFGVVFVVSWTYCITTYGYLFGVGLGWLPSIIVAAIARFCDVANARGLTIDASFVAMMLVSLVDGLGVEWFIEPKLLSAKAAREACFKLLEPILGPLR